MALKLFINLWLLSYALSCYFMPRNSFFGLGNVYIWSSETLFRRANKSVAVVSIILAISAFPLMSRLELKDYFNLVFFLWIFLIGCVLIFFNHKGKKAIASSECDFNFDALNDIKARLAEENSPKSSDKKHSKKGSKKSKKGRSSSGGLMFDSNKNLSIFFILMCAILFFASYFFAKECIEIMWQDKRIDASSAASFVDMAFFAIALAFILPTLLFRKSRLLERLPFSPKISKMERAIMGAARTALFFTGFAYSFLIAKNKIEPNPEIIFTMVLALIMIFSLPYFALGLSKKRTRVK